MQFIFLLKCVCLLSLTLHSLWLLQHPSNSFWIPKYAVCILNRFSQYYFTPIVLKWPEAKTHQHTYKAIIYWVGPLDHLAQYCLFWLIPWYSWKYHGEITPSPPGTHQTVLRDAWTVWDIMYATLDVPLTELAYSLYTCSMYGVLYWFRQHDHPRIGELWTVQSIDGYFAWTDNPWIEAGC